VGLSRYSLRARAGDEQALAHTKGHPEMAENANYIDCPLCGHRFSEDELGCHTACPFSENCKIACCPRCGYQIFRKSETVEWIKRFLGKG
jgi:DNA-directed RNA polymerase subunit RPC12/RpoP